MYPFNSHAREQTAQATTLEEWSCSYIHGAIANAESICYESTQPQDTAPNIMYHGTEESEADGEDAEDLEQESLATQPDEARVEVEDDQIVDFHLEQKRLAAGAKRKRKPI